MCTKLLCLLLQVDHACALGWPRQPTTLRNENGQWPAVCVVIATFPDGHNHNSMIMSRLGAWNGEVVGEWPDASLAVAICLVCTKVFRIMLA